MDGIIDALGIEPEVEEIEMSDDQELLSVYDLDGQSETTAVGQNPINAKPAKN